MTQRGRKAKAERVRRTAEASTCPLCQQRRIVPADLCDRHLYEWAGTAAAAAWMGEGR